jgi:hypothetical protein
LEPIWSNETLESFSLREKLPRLRGERIVHEAADAFTLTRKVRWPDA